MSKLEITFEENTPFTQPVRTTHEGFSGGSQILCIQVGNKSYEHYYTNINVSVSEVAGELIDSGSLFSNSGWGIKLFSSDEEPSEKEWANVLSNQSLNLQDIGNEDNASIDFIQKVWIRVFCPGNSDPNILLSNLKIKYNTLLVHNENI